LRQHNNLAVSGFGPFLHPPKNYKDLDMETKRTDLYEAPATEVVEVKTEGIICGSKDPNYNPWDNQNW
jgi:hypothetical protein